MKLERRIVLLRRDDMLYRASKKRAFGPEAQKLRDTLNSKRMHFDEIYSPVPIRRKVTLGKDLSQSQIDQLSGYIAFAVRAYFEDADAITKLKAENPEKVIGVYADPTISALSNFHCGGDNTPVGSWKMVARRLGVKTLQNKRLTGSGVKVAVVDSGIDSRRVSVSGGWSPPGTAYTPGSASPDHGTMCAFDVKIAAPDAEILDYALFRSTPHGLEAALSDAIAAFGDLINRLQHKSGPLVVNNSWSLPNRAMDEPIGSPGNYSANPDHPFNQQVANLVSIGADVFFSAGNCGEHCPDGRCGSHDIGPGASIHGANSHPDVVTVAAVTVNHIRLGYSSQGPGVLHQQKPDIAAYSHFSGSIINLADTGTSAASPVAAGVAAALRQEYSNHRLTPADLKDILQRSARDVNGHGWDHDLGYGVVNATGALRLLRQKSR